MTINIGNKTITSVYFTDFETAWKMEDAFLVLEYLKSNNRIVLGGDILTEKLEYNYDNWYYDVDTSQSSGYNVERSIMVAFEYLSKYIQRNGNSFYVVFVAR